MGGARAFGLADIEVRSWSPSDCGFPCENDCRDNVLFGGLAASLLGRVELARIVRQGTIRARLQRARCELSRAGIREKLGACHYPQILILGSSPLSHRDQRGRI